MYRLHACTTVYTAELLLYHIDNKFIETVVTKYLGKYKILRNYKYKLHAIIIAPIVLFNNCYIVSVKVQFFCLPIGQNRVTCRSTKRHVRQPVRNFRNETFTDRSIIKWVQYACVSTMKFQSSFF